MSDKDKTSDDAESAAILSEVLTWSAEHCRLRKAALLEKRLRVGVTTREFWILWAIHAREMREAADVVASRQTICRDTILGEVGVKRRRRRKRSTKPS